MQKELDDGYPDLDIQLLGVNEEGHELGNPQAVEGRDIPWLQDVDADDNGLSDILYDKWQVTFRDVVILDGNNELVDRYNLTVHDLAEPENYNTLRQMLIDAAENDPSSDEPPAPPTEVDLLPDSDSGPVSTDNVTNLDNGSLDRVLRVQVHGVTDGATVQLYADGVEIGRATADGADAEVVSDGVVTISSGLVTLTATQEMDGLTSAPSPGLDVTVDPTIAEFTSTPLTQATVDALFSYDAEHPEEGALGFVYTLIDSPLGVTVDSASGMVEWTPTADQVGVHHVTVVATDLAGNTRSQPFDVEVAPRDDGLGSLSGSVFLDANGNGIKDPTEFGVPGTLVELSGTDHLGGAVSLSVLTDDDGSYSFRDLSAGTYEIVQRQPAAMLDGSDTLGTLGGTSSNDRCAEIVLEDGESGQHYDFGERGLRASSISLQMYLASSPPIETLIRDRIVQDEQAMGNPELAEAIRSHGSDDFPTSQNRAPIAANDAFESTEDETLSVDALFGLLANDVDEDGDTLTAELVTDPAHGDLQLHEDGSFVYTPSDGFTGIDAFTYLATDGLVKSEPATVSLAVTSSDVATDEALV